MPQLLAQGYAGFVGFVELGYERLVDQADRNHNRTVILLKRRGAE